MSSKFTAFTSPSTTTDASGRSTGNAGSNVGSNKSNSQILHDYWNDDFAPLNAASRIILQQLRDDESNADLYHRIANTNHSNDGVHDYFAVENNANRSKSGIASPRLKHLQSIPWPIGWQERRKSTQRHSKLGFLPEGQLAWMSVDDRLYLWRLPDLSTTATVEHQSFFEFQASRESRIVTVGLVAPAPAIFVEDVKWCLIIATEEEIELCVLIQHTDDSSLILKKTGLVWPTDSEGIVCIKGTPEGRIFIGGNSGCLYEFTYTNPAYWDKPFPIVNQLSIQEQLQWFYDDDVDVPLVLTEQHSILETVTKLGKRTIETMTGNALNAEPRLSRQGPCRKYNWSRQGVASLLPEFLRPSSAGGSIVQIQYDTDRSILYVLKHEGHVQVWYVTDATASQPPICVHKSTLDVTQATRKYLEALSRGQTASAGSQCNFLGGMTLAQAGVGGMEAARWLLQRFEKSPHLCRPRFLHVIPPFESTRLTLLAVTGDGLRLYLTTIRQTGNIRGGGSTRTGAVSTPSSRLTLCHIRTPPPVTLEEKTESLIDDKIVDGMLPKMTKVLSFDASHYVHSRWTAAVENPAAHDNQNKLTNGDIDSLVSELNVVFGTALDCVARKVVHKEQNAFDDKDNFQEATGTAANTADTLMFVGGLAETVLYPLPTALTGGRVYEIASIKNTSRPILSLLRHSQTPSNTNLSIGLPPPFEVGRREEYTKMLDQWKSKYERNIHNQQNDEDKLMTPSSNSRLIWDLTKLFLRDQISHLLRRNKKQELTTDLYYVSSRDTSNGFSTTALEKSTRQSSRLPNTPSSSTSARLQMWSLRPSTVPLNELAWQVAQSSTQMVALNAGGMHYFQFSTILDELADVLIATQGHGIAREPSVTQVFTDYGYKEGCAFCLAIASGIGPTHGRSEIQQELRDWAIVAACARAYSPKLVATNEDSNSSASYIWSMDSLVPSGYKYYPSALLEGFCIIVSRLLRPVWHKPIVVVTEGRKVKQSGSSEYHTFPAKVEILLDRNVLNDLITPLQELIKVAKRIFTKALNTVPGLPQNQQHMMEVDDNDDGQFLTAALGHQSRLRNAGYNSLLPPHEVESLARLIEEKNVHSMYRLLSRAVQLLNLFNILAHSHHTVDVNEVDWGLLHGLSFAQLIQSSEGQERIERLLSLLVTRPVFKNMVLTEPSFLVDENAKIFAKHCYFFFSPGSLYAYQGLQCAANAMSLKKASKPYEAMASIAGDHFLEATSHWHSASLITGSMLHENNRGSFKQIALKALENNSPVATAAVALVELEMVDFVVNVCLRTAANFRQGSSRMISAQIGSVDANVLSFEFEWERHLYHRRSDQKHINASSNSNGVTALSLPSSGILVTSQDAVDTCHAILFFHLNNLLQTNEDLANRMVSLCASETNTTQFLHSFYKFLLESNNTNTLLRINSQVLEEWLEEKKELDLLRRYYIVQSKFHKCGQLLQDTAVSSKINLSLVTRIEYLTQALNAFKAATNHQQSQEPSQYVNNAQNKVNEIRELIRLADLQNRILNTLKIHQQEHKELPKGISQEQLEILNKTLVDVSVLFNEYAFPASLLDYCLLLLHFGRQESPVFIRALWNAIFCEELLPCATRSQHAYEVLTSLATEGDCPNTVTYIQENKSVDEGLLFEHAAWASKMESRVVRLGLEMYGTGANAVFPVPFLLERLELFRSLTLGNLSPDWALMVFVKVGVKYSILLETYDKASPPNGSNYTSGMQIERAQAMISLIKHWINYSQTVDGVGSTASFSAATARQDLIHMISNGRMFVKMEALFKELEAYSASEKVLDEFYELQNSIEQFSQI